MEIATQLELWPLRKPFTIARETMHQLPLLLLTISADGAKGKAEAAGVDYAGETPESMARTVVNYLSSFNLPPDRTRVLQDLPAGGARNAIDCVLWDWEAKLTGKRAASTAGLSPLRALQTVFTLSLAAPEVMAHAAMDAPEGAPLKLKLGAGDGRDLERVLAVRKAAPTRRLIVDVNGGWSFGELVTILPSLAEMGVELIEQPLPVGGDGDLCAFASPITLCADESFNQLTDLDELRGYGAVNIKLDKCGGLTAALGIAIEARRRGLITMVGSMLGTSLGMAPAFLVGQFCDFVDLDGPLLLSEDREHALSYNDAMVSPPEERLWG